MPNLLFKFFLVLDALFVKYLYLVPWSFTSQITNEFPPTSVVENKKSLSCVIFKVWFALPSSDILFTTLITFCKLEGSVGSISFCK